MTPLVPPGEAPLAGATVVVSAAVTFVYVYIGYRLSQRLVSARAQLASYQISLWWGGLGANVGLGALELALALANSLPLSLALTLSIINVALDCALLWGLVGFLTYVYTGRYFLLPLVALYSSFFGLVLYYYLSSDPDALAFQAGAPVIQYGAMANFGLAIAIVVILIGPELIGAILYLSLVRRTRVRDQRSRILLVGGGILLWFAIDVVLPDTSGAWSLVRNVVQVLPGIMSLIAYYPPSWAQRWFGLSVAARRPEDPAILPEP